MSFKKIISLVPFAFLFLFHTTAISQKLKAGFPAPDFEVITTNGDTLRLGQYKGQKIWLAFFRYAGCPVCNVRVQELIENYQAIHANGYTIIAVFESDNTMLRKYLKDSPAIFPFVGNPNLFLYKRYGVEKSFGKVLRSSFSKSTIEGAREGSKLYKERIKRDGSLSRIPADFIIDENGILQIVFYGTSISSHLPLSEIIK